MKLNFCEAYKTPKVICVEYDGEMSCFELGDLPPPPDDPRKLGIVFPCCINKKPFSKKEPKIVKLQDPKDKIVPKRTKSNMKRTDSQERPLPSLMRNANKDSILYVFDKKGFNMAVNYAKANINCADKTELNTKDPVGSRRNQDQQSTVNNKKGKSLHACKSRELRGGVLSTDCFCLRRNGLQYDCRRTGCQNSPLCSVLPAPMCEPARVACITHCANPHAEDLQKICELRPW